MVMNEGADETPHIKPWYNEENIRSWLVNWLRDHGYFQMTDMTIRGAETDLIVRSIYGATSRITVRGYPEDNRQDVARQWFACAVFDLARHQHREADIGLALALPADFTIYTTLAAEIGWLRDAMPFTIYWVSQSGTVHAE